ncbi:MAG: class I SAM-dependent methyltransferase [Halopseudomonas yangmingensis]
MDNTSALIERNADLFAGRRVLLAGFADTAVLSAAPADWQLWGWDYADCQAFTRSLGESAVCFSHLVPALEALDAAILLMPKAMERAAYALAQLAPLLGSGKPLYLIGENKGGIKRAASLLQAHGQTPVKLDAARHCQLWQVQVESPATFQLDQWQQCNLIELADQHIDLISLPGVFSHGRLDEGSALLLQVPATLPTGRVLDFGCGAGVLSVALARRNPQCHFELLDVDALALWSAQQTLERNGVNARVLASDGLQAVHGMYAAVVSNPPFHTGLRMDTGIAERFFEGIGKHLLSGGELRLVANGFLRYPPLIEAHVGPCRVLLENSRFRVYSALAG